MKVFTVTIDVPVIEGQVFAPAHVNWALLAGVKGYKIIGVAVHGACVSASLDLVTEDDFNPNTADWEGVVQRPGVTLQPTISVKDYQASTQTIAPKGDDATQFGKVGG